MDIIKNPMVIGVLAGTLTYIYMKNDIDKKNKIREKKGKEPLEVNLLIPLAVTFCGWLIMYIYLENQNQTEEIYIQQIEHNPTGSIIGADMGIVEMEHVGGVRQRPVAQTQTMPKPMVKNIGVINQKQFTGELESSPLKLDFADSVKLDGANLNVPKYDMPDILQ